MSHPHPSSPTDADAGPPPASEAELANAPSAGGLGRSASGLTRRDLLSGRFWRTLKGWTKGTTIPSDGPQPSLNRYPRTSAEVQAGQGAAAELTAASSPLAGPSTGHGATAGPQAASIQGILIAPVIRSSPAQRRPSEPARGSSERTGADASTAPPRSASRPPTIPLVRPPGAIEESQFLAGCTRCGDCVQACPHGAVFTLTSHPQPGSRGATGSGLSAAVAAVKRLPHLAGTPVLDADTQACLMCEDFPCIAACSPGVLSVQIPKVMATARITEQLCLAHQGSNCTACSDQCPVEGAIRIRDAMPTVDEAACTGCGVCRHVCPAAENAVLLMPAFVRPHSPGAATAAREEMK